MLRRKKNYQMTKHCGTQHMAQINFEQGDQQKPSLNLIGVMDYNHKHRNKCPWQPLNFCFLRTTYKCACCIVNWIKNGSRYSYHLYTACATRFFDAAREGGCTILAILCCCAHTHTHTPQVATPRFLCEGRLPLLPPTTALLLLPVLQRVRTCQ